VKTAVDRALELLASKLNSKGQIDTGNVSAPPSPELNAQVIVALTELGRNPATDIQFTKDGKTLIDGLATFYTGSGFAHAEGGEYNRMATEQAFYAMVACKRLEAGEKSLYDMTVDRAVKYAISVSETENGTVTPSAVTAAEGTTITLTVQPAIGYQLQKLTVNGTELTANEEGVYAFDMPAAEVVITAVFVRINDPAKAVADAITALIVTEADKATLEQIEAIESAYKALSDEQKLTVENYIDLQNRIAQFEDLLAEAKAEAKLELVETVSELEQDSYSKENWLKIQRLYSAALSDLSAASYTEMVEAILDDALYDIKKVPKGKELTVTFRLIGDGLHDNGTEDHEEYVTWIPTTTYKMPAGSTMYDVFTEAMEEFGLGQKGASNGYVESITAPDCLGEFDNGVNSGWMYTVNGDHPGTGLTTCDLEDGDIIIWHYVDDYIEEERTSSSVYYYRWLEARDISPESYIKNKLGKILSVGKHGSVKPDAIKLSDIGKTVTFTFKPDEGYKVRNVIIDGDAKGSITSYTYRNLRYDSRIVVEFEKKEAVSFTDVAENSWYYDDVRFVVENGLMGGTSEDTFSPDLSMTRAMLVTVLYRMEGQPAVSGSSTFADVAPGQYYTDAVLWAAKHGIVGGYDEDTFGTNDNITREQMAVILYRYAEHEGYDLNGGN
ncbi:MAG: S-layer homology domain-containing protein, partial [Clostridia bacterium]|nr:S-layer homology domain-containing protein [Clostridia bacterium]